MIAFYDNLWSEQAVYDEREIMRQLPGSLNDELITFLYQDMIASVALFHNMQEEVMKIPSKLMNFALKMVIFALQMVGFLHYK